ncbi:hypothetical protein GCM10023322_52170 [Rugosimonospora acidiphila]|uniref:AAA+ ATPase domain-containing protein n=1 Tax=Rugosimonospora acidiphila TaxID=556531 RepID=A0ABP9S7P1_9ACTN
MSWRGTLPAACWESSQASQIIPVEAESTPDGVFLATHSSLPIALRNQVQNAREPTIVDERALLTAVQQQPADQPIIPILGESGTGKSHLVRWLRINLKTKPSTRLIFVPKHNVSLRGILDRILTHATGERADDLRRKVVEAADAVADHGQARVRLRNELAFRVEHFGPRRDVGPEEAEIRTYLSSPTGLPALLQDPQFRALVMGDGSAIARLVSEKISGKGREDKGDAFGFRPTDLQFTLDDVSKAGAHAREVAASLQGHPELREAAARMLNEQLAPAVGEVFGVSGSDLKDILVELRVELRKQGLELLLLIEDFSIFQGIQGGLIDAITLISTQELDLCPMRVVMAVTTGYFTNEMPDTVYTRTYKVFDLELPEDGRRVLDRTAFVAKYLNAVRVGAAQIEERYRSNESDPNACEQCPVTDSCHAAFGSARGYGLFPFNRAALTRAILSQSKGDKFVARDILTRVIRPVLQNDQESIESGAFPTAEFYSDFRAGIDPESWNVEFDNALKTPGDDEISARRVRMVRFWGSGNGPENLSKVIHSAFGVAEVDGLASVRGVRSAGNATATNEPVVDVGTTQQAVSAVRSVRQEPRLVRAVDQWRQTGSLEQGVRNELRNLVHSAVVEYLMLDDGLGGSSSWTTQRVELRPSFDARYQVALDGPEWETAIIAIDRDNDAEVRALRALAWVNAEGGWLVVPNGEALQRLCHEQVVAWADRVSHALLPNRDARDEPELARLARLLLAMGKVLGIRDAYRSDWQSRLRAIFAPVPSGGSNDGRPALSKWREGLLANSKVISREHLQARLMRLAAFAQGGGKPLALDIPRLQRALQDRSADAQWPANTPENVKIAEDLITNAMGSLEQLYEEAVQLLPDLSELGADIKDAAGELNRLIDERAGAGELPGTIDRGAIGAAAKAIRQGDQQTVNRVREELSGWADLPVDERLKMLTGDWDNSAIRVRTWHEPAQEAVRALEQQLAGGQDSETPRDHDDAVTRLATAIETLQAEFAQLTGQEQPR